MDFVNLTPHAVVVRHTCPICSGTNRVPDGTYGCQGCGSDDHPDCHTSNETTCSACTGGLLDSVFPPSGQVARVAQENRPQLDMDGIPTTYCQYGPVVGFPRVEASRDTVYIVSMLVAQRLIAEDALHVRNDFVSPDTGPTAVRDKDGKIVAVRGFVRY